MVKNQESNKTNQLIERIAPLVAPLGYEVVHLEVQTGRGKTLRLFIDHLQLPQAEADSISVRDKKIGIEDCVKVTKALDEPLEQLPELEQVFHGASYELEVSSPGVDRPLRTPHDFERFAGQEARIHVYRPLTGEELGNSSYAQKNPKQKNFMGTLKGFRDERVLLTIKTNSVEEVSIPLPLIAKANLEPSFELS